MIKFNIYTYVWQYISPRRRLAQIIQFLNALVSPLVADWNDFEIWSEYKIYEVNLTSQTLALQEHLNNLLDNTERRIMIVHYDDQGLFIRLSTEGYEGIAFSLKSEEQGQFVALKGEIQEQLGVSFIVKAPSSINPSLIDAELEKYKLAGTSYIIEQF